MSRNVTLTDMVIEHLKDGLRPTYHSLVESWDLEEINGKESSVPTTLEGFSTVITNFEQRSRKFNPAKPGVNRNNFLSQGGERDTSKAKGCITCSIAGRDPNHDFKSCRHSIKWRQKNGKIKNNLVTEKKRGRDELEEVDTSERDNDKKKKKKKKKVQIQVDPVTSEDDSEPE